MAKKILIVEDDIAFYNLCAVDLKLKGYEVSNVSDGQLAFEQVRAQKPDLVLLDIILPRKNGLEVLEELRQSGETNSVKIVMLTNFGTDANVSKAIELGADDYIMKYNIVPSDLSKKVADVLGDSGTTAVKFTN